MRELYSILELRPGASRDEIRAAYVRLARQNHPDVCPNDTEAAERFRKIHYAYETLSNQPEPNYNDIPGQSIIEMLEGYGILMPGTSATIIALGTHAQKIRLAFQGARR
jgi:DnaJ-class molecular chaperone